MHLVLLIFVPNKVVARRSFNLGIVDERNQAGETHEEIICQEPKLWSFNSARLQTETEVKLKRN